MAAFLFRLLSRLVTELLIGAVLAQLAPVIVAFIVVVWTMMALTGRRSRR
jgi:hypothetical protein